MAAALAGIFFLFTWDVDQSIKVASLIVGIIFGYTFLWSFMLTTAIGRILLAIFLVLGVVAAVTSRHDPRRDFCERGYDIRGPYCQ
jgi:hypothetical protein